MQFSESWLRQYVNPSLDSDALGHSMTMAGLERLTMLRYGVDDLRLFFENDLRFLAQFPA